METEQGEPLARALSPLEADVLERLGPGKGKALKVREIYRLLRQGRRKVALTSVAVILDRLFEKGRVRRRIETGRGGLRYVYFKSQAIRQAGKSAVEDAVNRLIERFGNVAISYFNERFVKGKKRRGKRKVMLKALA